MATNPMKRQKNIAALTGALITLLITGSIIAFLFIQLSKMKEEEKKAEARMMNVMVLTEDVKSGQLITSGGLFTSRLVDSLNIPSDAIKFANDLEGYRLQTLDGKEIICERDGEKFKYYIEEDNNKIEIEQRDDEKFYRKDNNEEVEFNRVPLVAKIDMNANTVLAASMLAQADELVTSDVRVQEYNMLNLQSDIQNEDVIDIRLRMPTGQDYIVISKKAVTIPEQDGIVESETIRLNLSEGEILTMSSAIIDAYMINGSELYVTKYVEPGLQDSATPTYPIRNDIVNLINNDPNITSRAMAEIKARYEKMSGERNDKVESILNTMNETERNQNVQAKIEESVTKSKELRKKFLEQAASAAAATTE